MTFSQDYIFIAFSRLQSNQWKWVYLNKNARNNNEQFKKYPFKGFNEYGADIFENTPRHIHTCYISEFGSLKEVIEWYYV